MIEYETPKEWEEVVKYVRDIGKALREDAVSKNFSPEVEYRRLLNIATGSYMYLVTEYKKWRSIKENNEVAKFCALKNEIGSTKFTAASGQIEASNFVCKERYYRDYLEGWMLASEQAIYTLKKHLGSDEREHNVS